MNTTSLTVLVTLFTFVQGTNCFAQSGASFFKDKTRLENPFSLRDPFKVPSKQAIGESDEKITGDRVKFSNVSKVDPNTPVNTIQIVGVYVGKERRAIAKVGGQTVLLKEGMKFSGGTAELKAILPGGIVFVEKITNVYGQEEYLETVVPISN